MKNSVFEDITLEETNLKTTFLRVYKPNVNNKLLLWHESQLDCTITVVNNAIGWKIIKDNITPFQLTHKSTICVGVKEFYRLRRTQPSSELILKITQLK